MSGYINLLFSILQNLGLLNPNYSPCLFFFCREEYGKLFDFVNAKKLNIKNRGFKEVIYEEVNSF